MMKKVLLIAVGLFLGINVSAQQTSFGVTAGYADITAKISASTSDIEASTGISGFYVGALADITLSPNFHVQPSVNLAIADDSNFLLIPVMAKYYISDSGFHLQAGPQGTLILEDSGGLNTFGIDLALGAGYDINSHFFIEARYAFELTNRFPDDYTDAASNATAKVKFNTFTAGVGYKF